jgi:hypothetical protein
MLWPLDCFVARAPRNDGWVAAHPIDSVVIGRRLSRVEARFGCKFCGQRIMGGHGGDGQFTDVEFCA